MKVKFKYAMAMAAALVLGFSSCSNDNEKDAVESASKDVTIHVSNPSTYAEEASAVDQRPDLNDLNVYFIGAGVIKKKGTMTSAEITAGKTFTDVPGSATKVVIIGNATALASPSVSTIALNDPESKLNTLMFEQSKQTDPTTDVNVYGDATIGGTVGAETAAVTMAPAISRIEIAKVEAKSEAAGAAIELSGFKLAGIYINNTYMECGTDYETLPADAAKVLNYGQEEDIWTDGTYPTRFKDEWTSPTEATSFAPATGTKWSYYVMPVVADKGTTIDGATQKSVPHIILKITDAKAEGYELPNPAYVTVKELQVGGASLTVLARGKVYSIAKLSIAGENLGARPERPAMQDVLVTAEITPWTNQPVDPIIP